MDTTVIGTLGTCFWVCLSCAILFFAISVVLFFVFDIRTIFNIRTGRAQAKTIKEMQTANKSTGRLRVDGKTQTSKLSEQDKKIGRAPAVTPPDVSVQSYNSGESETEVLPRDNAQSAPYGNTEFAETSVLSNATTNDLDMNETAYDTDRVNFRIVKNLIFINTDELIE